MNIDHYKTTDERDAEPQLEQHECEECGGSGYEEHEAYVCECCNGTGHVMVMER